MTDKNIYEMLNDFDLDINNYEEDPMTDIEKQRAKNNFSESLKKGRKSNKKAGIAVAAAFVLLVGLTNNPVSARVNMLLDSFSYSMSQELGSEHPGNSYTVNQYAGIGDYQIKVADILLDEKSISLNYLIESPDDEGQYSYLDVKNINLYINGEKVNISGMHGSGKILENGLYQSLSTYDFEKAINLEDANEVKVQAQGISSGEETLTTDSVEFVFEGGKDELSGQAKTLQVNEVIESEVGPIKVEKLVFNPYQSQVYFTIPVNEQTQEMFFEADILDEEGRNLSFSGGNVRLNEKENVYECHLFTDFLGELSYEDLMKADKLDFQVSYSKKESGEAKLLKLGESIPIEIEK